MKVDREEFLELLQTLAPAVASEGAIVEKYHLWFDGKFAYAYNGGMGIRVVWKSELNGGVLGAPLIAILKSSSAKEVSLEQSGIQLVVKLGRAKVTLPMLEPDRNPWPVGHTVGSARSGQVWGWSDPLPKVAYTTSLTEELITGLQQASVIKRSKPERTEHYGITIFPAKDDIELYTTDSVSLAQIVAKVKLPKALSKTLLPFGFVGVLTGLGVDTEVSFLPDAIVASRDSVLVCTHLLDTKNVLDLPAYVDKTLKGAGKKTALPEGFAEALVRADALAGAAEAYINVSLDKKALSLDGDFAAGKLEERFTLKTEVSEMSAGTIKVSLANLQALAKEAVGIAVVPKKVLVLSGEGNNLYMTAQHE